MNTVRKSVCFLLSTLLILGSAQAMADDAAATLREVVGTVLVNQGKGYQVAQSGMKVANHTRVLTKDSSSVVVISKLGCPTRLGPDNLYVVEEPDPCHGGVAMIQKIDPAFAATLGGTGGGAAIGGLSTSTLELIAGGVAAIGIGVGVGLGTSGGGGRKCVTIPAVSPVSPQVVCQ